MKGFGVQAQLIQKIELENGLVLEFYDGSRKIAGDRYRVTLIANIRISVRSIDLKEDFPGVEPQALLRALGETVTFEKKMERNFIDAGKKDACLNALRDSFLSGTRSYLSHPEFARKFIFKTYRETVAKKRIHAL